MREQNLEGLKILKCSTATDNAEKLYVSQRCIECTTVHSSVCIFVSYR